MRPCLAIVSFARFSISVSRVTSAIMPVTPSSLATVSTCSWWYEDMTTVALSFLNALASARPSPDVLPVMTMTLPFSSIY